MFFMCFSLEYQGILIDDYNNKVKIDLGGSRGCCKKTLLELPWLSLQVPQKRKIRDKKKRNPQNNKSKQDTATNYFAINTKE